MLIDVMQKLAEGRRISEIFGSQYFVYFTNMKVYFEESIHKNFLYIIIFLFL